MKITQLDIEGFRSLKNVSWKPGDLNVIIGPNGSGKSNLLRSLEMISAAAQGQLNKYIQSAGGIDVLAWDGRADYISYLISNSATSELPHKSAYQVRLSRLGRANNYRVEREDLSTGDTAMVRMASEALVTIADQSVGVGYDASVIQDEELFLTQVASPIAGYRSIQIVQRHISDWLIYQNLRVDYDASIRKPATARLENTVGNDGQNLINVLHTHYAGDRDFKNIINSAMLAAFGNDFDELIFPPASDQRIQLRVRWKSLKREQSTADLSDGTLRFLFLLAVLASPSPAPLIAIDEPETGLHPSMLPIIAELAVDAAERTQVVFTTHSDQFLDAFTGTKPTTTVAKWENGETTLTTLSGGDLAYWLKDYTLGKLFRSGELESLA